MSPDGPQKPLPEENLLKLIRGKGAPPSVAAGPGSATSQRAADPLPAPRGGPANRGVFSGRAPELPSIRVVIQVLVIVLAVEVGALLVQAFRPVPATPIPSSGVESLPGVEPPTPTDREPAQPAVEMPSLSASATRVIFASPSMGGPSTPTDTGPKGGPSAAANALAARLTLMGLVAGNPAQAIIEDSQTKKSYFVTVGQAVVEGAVLDQVLENRVILDLAGEKIELTL